MTTEELTKLSPEEKRVKIAKACGWRRLHCLTTWRFKDTDDYDYDSIPDYLSDLNAMHEAENRFTDNDEYWARLLAIVEETKDVPWREMLNLHAIRYVGHATAAQRADAFLLTL